MHYYQFNIGDYHSHTSHLEPLEDIAYRRLMDWCYLHESPLPEDIESIAKKIRMRTHCECIADVLREFFTLTNEGWINSRIVKEVDAFKEKSEKAKASARARWDKKPNKNNKKEVDANALRTECEGNAKHKPLTNNQEPIKILPKGNSSAANCPHEDIVNLYHETLPELAGIKVWSKTRQAHLKARWRENEKAQTLDYWDRFFNYVKDSDFLMGKVPQQDGRAWKADLSWLIKEANYIKIIEGKYHA